jgi:hypothetical protein
MDHTTNTESENVSGSLGCNNSNTKMYECITSKPTIVMRKIAINSRETHIIEEI